VDLDSLEVERDFVTVDAVRLAGLADLILSFSRQRGHGMHLNVDEHQF